MIIISLVFITVAPAAIKASIITGQAEGESCVDKITKANGTCQMLSQCETAIEDFRKKIKTPTLCTFDGVGRPVVCCSDIQYISVETNGPKDTRRLSDRKCEEYSSLYPKQVPIPLLPGPEPLSKICDYDFNAFVGGDNASLEQFPHMAAIGWLDSNDKYVFSCGGSLISPRFVLTSAQCTYNWKDLPLPVVVRLGDQNLDDKVADGASPINVPIRHIHKHPEYSRPRIYNNIALLELEKDVAFNEHIRPACLWTKPNFPGYKNAVNSGFGESYSANIELTNQLKVVVRRLLENDICQDILPKTAAYQIIRDNQLCAEKLGAQDAFQGVPGSPLQVASKESPCTYHIIGVTSIRRIFPYGDNQRVSVYTRVSSYLNWIERIVWANE